MINTFPSSIHCDRIVCATYSSFFNYALTVGDKAMLSGITPGFKKVVGRIVSSQSNMIQV